MMKTRWIGGMTLIEVAVVLSIIATATALAVPSIVGIMPKFLLNAQVSALHNDFQRARYKSISLNTQYRMSFTLDKSPDPDTYKGEYYDLATGKWVADPGMTSREIREGVDLAYIGSAGEKKGTYLILFNPDGTADSQKIYLNNSKDLRRRIEVNGTTGFIKVHNSW
jgi:prepilin-type N-terminal cleavage/methylation domain-containing protein